MILEDERLLKLPEVLAMVGLSRNKVLDLMAAKAFPANIWLGQKSRWWKKTEVLAWVDGLVPRLGF